MVVTNRINCAIMWLLSAENRKEVNINQMEDDEEFPKIVVRVDEKELQTIELFRSLSTDDQDAILSWISTLEFEQ